MTHEAREAPSGTGGIGRGRPALVAVAVYVAAAAFFTWPLLPRFTTVIATTDAAGDPALHLWTLGWDLQTLSTHPLWLLNGRVFHANIFFPAANTLAYSDHLLLQAVALWPVHAITRDLVVTYNVLLFGSLIASALAMHLLARSLLHSERAAYVAGTVYGFAPYHFTHLIHIQLQALYFLPLSFFFLHRIFTERRRRDTIALGIVMGLQTLSSIYYGTIGAIGVGCAALTLAALDGRLRDWRLMMRGLFALALAAVIALPWSIPYLRVAHDTVAPRTLVEASRGSAVPASYIQAPATNLLYGRTGWLRPGDASWLARKDSPEQGLFVGFTVLLAAAYCAAALRTVGRRVVVVYLIVGLAGVVLSLGPDGVRPLYAWLHDALLPMQAIRAPARFSVLALCAVAVLAAGGVRAWEIRRPGSATSLTAGVLAAIALEFSNGTTPFAARPALTSDAGRWLASQPGSGAVICLPIGFDTTNTPCMLQSLEHGRSVVNGYSGLRPPFMSAVVSAMAQMPSVESLQMLSELRVEYVVSDLPLITPDALSGILIERARFDAQRVYQVAWSPEILSRLATTNVSPAEPGPVTFMAGESATYQVRWTSGPIDAVAGQATVSIETPRESEAFRFVVSARSADWLSRIYRLDAHLETTAGPRLLPLAHVSAMTQGSRQIRREAVFDPQNRRVRVTTGDSAPLALPLLPDARDPITVLFYLRTLPLDSGAHMSIPMAVNGVQSTVELEVGPVERKETAGRSWSARRVNARPRQRIERRRPLEVTAWISTDARRVPIRFDMHANFGTVRADLTEYRGSVK